MIWASLLDLYLDLVLANSPAFKPNGVAAESNPKS
jgi:hypothetical protein